MPEKNNNNNILIVGLGASAGGLKALREFLKSLPKKPGMAFIVVLHLAPDRESNLSQILQKETSLEVLQVKKSTKIECDHIYVIPPHKFLSVEIDHLELTEPDKEHGLATIDLLFRTLGQKKQKYSAGIILSGSGSDGTTGMKIIKEKGGITLAQDPDEAGHSSMPVHAIDTGAVDKVLPVKNMVEELIRYKEVLGKSLISGKPGKLSDDEETEQILSKIFKKVRSKISHDFSNYKRSSVLRRIDRRMRINRVYSLKEYLSYLDDFPEEIDNLFKELLINVTNFFRDPEAFKAFEKEIIPKLFEEKSWDHQIRIWVPGCATGEEAYSIAILLQEYAAGLTARPEIQIFASDVDQDSLEKARAGKFSKSIENDISKKRLQKFFKPLNGGYIINEEIRDMILFASHDLLRNAPFSKLDLITCRNLLIYLNRNLQTEIFNLFHYALNDRGWLFLGKSDSRIGSKELFENVNKEHRLYRKKPLSHKRIIRPDLPLLYKSQSDFRQFPHTEKKSSNLEKFHWGMLARVYAPHSVLISRNFDVIHSTEGINKYLEYTGGEPSRNILDMIKPDIRQALRSILYQVKNKEMAPVQKYVHVKMPDKSVKLEITARRFSDKKFPEGIIHLIFKEISNQSEKQKDDKGETDEDVELVVSLKNELEYAKEQLQLTTEEYETSNEELKSSNEELQSMNEELQSTTEELETSKEELQSVNEELKTVNDQLENKVEELSRAHSDLENLMEATEVGIIFVDRDFRIKRFTPVTKEVFNLLENDVGRPLQHITHNFKYDGLPDDIKQVLDSLDKIKKAVSTHDGRWYVMRLRPYRSSEDKIEGVVLSFTEFTELKEARETLLEQRYQETLATLSIYAMQKEDTVLVAQRGLQQVCTLFKLSGAAFFELDEESNTFKVAAQSGCGREEVELMYDEKSDLVYALNAQNPVTVADFSTEDRFTISPFVADKNFTSAVYTAIKGLEDRFGVIAIYSDKPHEFSNIELNFIQVVANILCYSYEQKKAREILKKTNKKLHNEIKRSERYQKEILNTSIFERWELGSYLHDNLGQLLASAKILIDEINIQAKDSGLDLEPEIGELNDILDSSMSGIRDVVHEIIPVDIEREGVAQAFRILMKQMTRLYNVNCHLENENRLEEIKNREIATHLYHIVQESMKNAVRHGKAENLWISVERKNENFFVIIKDDGTGFKESLEEIKGKGVRIMEHRMNWMGGTFEIKEYSDPDKSGTMITCSVPFKTIRKEKK